MDALCGKVLDDEDSTRWAWLYRCVQVDMSGSEPKLTALLGAGEKPSFVVVGQDCQVVARIPAVNTASKFQKGLKDALGTFPEYPKFISRELADEDLKLVEGKALVKANDLAAAKALYDKLRWTKIRVVPQFDKAVKDGWDCDQRIARRAIDPNAK